MTRFAVSLILATSVLAGCGVPNAASDANDAAFNEALYSNLDLPADNVASTPALSPKELGSVCKAAIASSFGRSASIMKIVSNSDGMVRISYKRPDDGKRWTNDCRAEGNRILWRSVDAFAGDGPGVWRTRPDDDVLTFRLNTHNVDIVTQYAGGSETGTETYPLL